jgi:outer membrane lipoprotein SlyB
LLGDPSIPADVGICKSTLEKNMRTLTVNEIQQVSGGGGYGQTVGTVAMTSGGAALGGYFAAARLGATFGSAAGPIGAVLGGIAGASAAYLYYSYAAPSLVKKD